MIEQLVEAVAVVAGEGDEFLCLLDDGATFERARNRDATPAPEFEQSLVAEYVHRPQDGVGVDAEDGGEILGGREALSRLGLSLGDRTSNLTGHLLVEIGGVTSVQLDIQHGASNTSAIELGMQL